MKRNRGERQRHRCAGGCSFPRLRRRTQCGGSVGLWPQLRRFGLASFLACFARSLSLCTLACFRFLALRALSRFCYALVVSLLPWPPPPAAPRPAA